LAARDAAAPQVGVSSLAKEPQQIDRGLVGPVHILHDQHVQLARLAYLP
jgi:hypothetical protein